MPLQLFGHPFSSYCQKVLIALYEHGTPFEFRVLGPDQAAAGAEFARRWPLKKFPLLADGERTVLESSVIIEYLEQRMPPALRLIPLEPAPALEVRMLDRCSDQYLMTPMQKIVGDCLRATGDRDPRGVNEARALLDAAYAWFDDRLQGRTWAAGERFSLADCAAAPALFYADWVQPIGERWPALRGYRARLLARPSFARAVDEARPYRALFPPGAPDRD